MPLRAVFLGSPEFSVPSLEALSSDPRLDIVAVVTQPDRVAGRGRHLTPPPVKVAAERLGLPVFQPATLKDSEVVENLRQLDADVFVVVAYGEILRREVLQMPRCGCLNVHPSLLPKYRGSAPIQAAILGGDTETGVTIMQLVRKLDAGPLLAQQIVPLNGTETAGALSEQLAGVAAKFLPDVTVAWCESRITAVPQSEDAATFTRELRKEDGQIDWTRPSDEIERLVRAMAPWPTAWTVIHGRRLTILDASVDEKLSNVGGELSPGELRVSGKEILVGTGSVPLRLNRVQPEGRKAVNANDWARGARLVPGDRLGQPQEQ